MTTRLDCSQGEGGGAVVRISTALAAAMELPLQLVNIRAKRKNPGLRAQHIEGVNAIKQLSGINATNLTIGSSSVELTPGLKKNSHATVKIATAGSIGLTAQTVQNYAFSQKRRLNLSIEGGVTHGKWAPSVEYVKYVTHNLFNKLGKKVVLQVNRYGFYPKGGANCSFTYSENDEILPLILEEKGRLEKIEVYSTVSVSLRNRDVAERQFKAFSRAAKSPIKPVGHINYVDSLCAGTGLTAVTYYSNGAVHGSFYPGDRGVTSEQVGERCAKQWKVFHMSKAAVDEYAADQIIVPLALTEGKSVFTTNELTSHTRTNIMLAEKFTQAKIEKEKIDDIWKITIKKD